MDYKDSNLKLSYLTYPHSASKIFRACLPVSCSIQTSLNLPEIQAHYYAAHSEQSEPETGIICQVSWSAVSSSEMHNCVVSH